MKKIKLFDPFFGKEEETAIKKTLKSRFWASGAGTGNVLRFENEFAKYIDSKSCVALNSGTAALHLALSLVDIKNKEVILPSLSFVSTAHAILYNGGKPVFVDVDSDTLCIDPEKIECAITKKTKVILPVHFAGMPCDLNRILKLCKEFKITLIEDAAHAAGASYNKKKIGIHGIAVCFSFHPVKNLAMPTGGAITLNGMKSNEFDNKLRIRRWCGITNRKETKYDVNQLGWNYYMNEFSAAIGLKQLKKLDKSNAMRRKIARIYSREISIEHKMPYDDNCSYHLYWIQVKNRTTFMKKMKENYVETGIHYKPIHTMQFYKEKLNLTITENVGKQIVSIPIHPSLAENEIDKIIQLVNKFS
jgi:dTDP-4-amino-4,6-dideoxygalactose transaminase